LDPVVVAVVEWSTVDMWSTHTRLPPNDRPWSERFGKADIDAQRTPAYGRGEAEWMIAVGVMLIVDPLVSSWRGRRLVGPDG
jgi:hypothetical protein